MCYSLWYNAATMLPAGARERAFKQFKSPVLNVLIMVTKSYMICPLSLILTRMID